MNTSGRILSVAAMTVFLLAAIGCSERNPTELEVARAPVDPVVFDDELGDVYFQPFFQTHYTAMSQDSVYAFDGFAPDGARSLKFNIPPANSALGPYTGGVLTPPGGRDLTDFNALTFYARANVDVALDAVGFGNDNTGNSLYEAGRGGIALTGDWSFVVVPIPSSSRLISERGLFTIAESREDPHTDGYDIWIDEIRFAKLGNIEPFRPTMKVANLSAFIGASVNINETYTIFRVDGAPVIVNHAAGYFDYVSSDPSVAIVDGASVVAVGSGQARVTGSLENPADPAAPLEVFGWVDVTAYQPPTVAATPPTHPAGNVIALFSDVYDDVLVDTWRTDWSTANYSTYVVAGNSTKMYSSLGYAVILFETIPIDSTPMTHFHMDVYAPVGTGFKIDLACPPPAGWTSQAPPAVEVVLDGTTTPEFVAGQWSSLDIPLENFQYNSSTQPEDFDWTSITQLVISSGDAKLVLVDNIYFRK